MAEVQAVEEALVVFSRAPDKEQLERANRWLQDFQHSSNAWSICNDLLTAPESTPAAKLFAAQTFRTKVTYDLNQVAPEHLPALRTTLMGALSLYHAGPRTIIVQLCLALSGLALQLPSWGNCVQDMAEHFGRNPASVPALLQFLTVLPEEINGNFRIPITDEDYKARAASILTANSQAVLDALTMYITAQGVTMIVQAEIFRCLSSWLSAGEIDVSSLASTPLLAYAFEALASDDLFDVAVDVICDTIHETQEVDDSQEVIGLIVPQVIALEPLLTTWTDDSDKIRGLARIFAEAGETYRGLILHHTETFFPLVKAIGHCSAHPDLDVVPITFPFWMRLAQSIGKKPSVSPLFNEAYQSLMSIIIRHLHFPTTAVSQSSQEAENFRHFRHVMGDTLKDCCVVLGTDVCLMTAYGLVTSALSRDPSTLSWQEVEAPLFSMRSMGAEMDPDDEKVVPKIIDLIPNLPNHPRIQYATLLLIARYTEWTSKHPDHLPKQLQYVSAGFDSPEEDVQMAAGQALKYLCQDCKMHLEAFLPQLHTFVSSKGLKLAPEERVQVYEAIGYVISAMSMEQAASSLRMFALDILTSIHSASVQPAEVSKEQFKQLCNSLECLETMLAVVRTFGNDLPAACQTTCQEAWSCLDLFIGKYGSDYDASDRVTRLIRHGVTFFGLTALPVAPAVISRMTSSFETTGNPGYVWIIGKLVCAYGNEEGSNLRAAFKESYDRVSAKVLSSLQEKTPAAIPDVLEDYMHMLIHTLDYAPDAFFESPESFSIGFKAAMTGLTLIQTDLIFASLDLIRLVLTHDSILPPPADKPVPPKFPVYASRIQQVVEKEGYELISYLLSGLTGDFPEDSSSNVITIFRNIAAVWPQQLLSWLPSVLQQLNPATIPDEAKTTFLTETTNTINAKQWDKIKYAILGLHRQSLKARERRRTAFDRR